MLKPPGNGVLWLRELSTTISSRLKVSMVSALTGAALTPRISEHMILLKSKFFLFDILIHLLIINFTKFICESETIS